MKPSPKSLYLTDDGGLIRHWKMALGSSIGAKPPVTDPLAQIGEDTGIVWLDLSMAKLPQWSHPDWRRILQDWQIRVVAASSNPTDSEGMAALDAGCAAYCHAFSDILTLKRVREVVVAGNVWVGRNLMTQLLKKAAHAGQFVPAKNAGWQAGLTSREQEVAKLAANGSSNQSIAEQCQITERTVKAHLSAVFEKLHVTDRLQLALRVHGIQ